MSVVTTQPEMLTSVPSRSPAWLGAGGSDDYPRDGAGMGGGRRVERRRSGVRRVNDGRLDGVARGGGVGADPGSYPGHGARRHHLIPRIRRLRRWWVTGVAALILAAFGLDSVPEVGGLGVPAFAASSPDDGVPGAVRAAAVPRWAAGGVGMRSAPAGFVVWVRPLQNLCGDARRSSHGPPDRTRRSHGAGRRTIPDDSRGISAVNRLVLMV
jgi:hypothetical protein